MSKDKMLPHLRFAPYGFGFREGELTSNCRLRQLPLTTP